MITVYIVYGDPTLIITCISLSIGYSRSFTPLTSEDLWDVKETKYWTSLIFAVFWLFCSASPLFQIRSILKNETGIESWIIDKVQFSCILNTTHGDVTVWMGISSSEVVPVLEGPLCPFYTQKSKVSSNSTIKYWFIFSSPGWMSGELLSYPRFSVGVRVHKNFNLAYNSWTIIGRAFIFHMCIPCDKTFPWVPKFLTSWPWSLTYF